jgi:hypothetical protein
MKSFDLEYFTSTLTTGVSNFLIKNNIQFKESSLNKLKIELTKEFEANFLKQSKTPTQIINIFLKKELKTNINLTPQDLGDEALNSILNWGILKSKSYINE